MRTKYIFALALVVLVGVSLNAQTTAKSVPGFKFTSPNNLVDEDNRIKATSIALPRGNTLLFTYKYQGQNKSNLFQSSVINKKGQATAPATFFSTQYYLVDNIDAVWVDDASVSGAAKGYILVYFLIAPFDEGEKRAYLYSIRLSDKGKALGKARALSSFDWIAPHYIATPSLVAVRGSDSILVVYSAVYYQNTNNTYGPRKAGLFAVQTDLEGNRLGKAQSIPLPNGGNFKQLSLFDPIWTGKRWFVPLSSINFALQGDIITKKSDELFMLAVTPSGSSVKAKLKSIYQTKEIYGGINNASFVPMADGSSASAAPTFTLVFGTAFYDPKEKVDLEYVTTRLFLQTINKKGRPKGSAREIKLPARKHRIKNVNHNLYWEDEGAGELSNVALNAEGEPIVAIFQGTHLTLKTNQAKKLWDTELGIYKIDIDKGIVKATQWQNTGLPDGDLTNLQLLGSGKNLRGFANLIIYPGAKRLEIFGIE